MADLISTMIRELERQKTTIDQVLDVLRERDEDQAGPSASVSIPASSRKGQKRSAAVRKKMRGAALARYARARAEADRVPF
jgi:hypothetical protein